MQEDRLRVARTGTLGRKRPPDLLARILVERDDLGVGPPVRDGDQQVPVHKRCRRHSPRRQLGAEVPWEAAFPKHGTVEHPRTDQSASRPQCVYAVAVDSGRRSRPGGVFDARVVDRPAA